VKYTLLVVLTLFALACVPTRKYNTLLASHAKRDSQYLMLYGHYAAMRAQRDTLQNVTDTLQSVLRDYIYFIDRDRYMHKRQMEMCGCNIDSLAAILQRRYDSAAADAQRTQKISLDSLLQFYKHNKK
jgi:hypothetical protein